MVEREYYKMCFNAWKTKWIPAQVYLLVSYIFSMFLTVFLVFIKLI